MGCQQSRCFAFDQRVKATTGKHVERIGINHHRHLRPRDHGQDFVLPRKPQTGTDREDVRWIAQRFPVVLHGFDHDLRRHPGDHHRVDVFLHIQGHEPRPAPQRSSGTQLRSPKVAFGTCDDGHSAHLSFVRIEIPRPQRGQQDFRSKRKCLRIPLCIFQFANRRNGESAHPRGRCISQERPFCVSHCDRDVRLDTRFKGLAVHGAQA